MRIGTSLFTTVVGAQFWENFPKFQLVEIWSNFGKLARASDGQLREYRGSKGGAMWLQCEKEAGTERDALKAGPAWPCAETLRTIAELNEQCLELLTEQAMLRQP